MKRGKIMVCAALASMLWLFTGCSVLSTASELVSTAVSNATSESGESSAEETDTEKTESSADAVTDGVIGPVIEENLTLKTKD